MTPERRSIRAARALFVAFGAGYGLLSLLRYWTYHSRSLDMAFYVRLVWGMGHGRPDNPIVGAPHWLGLHLEPALLLPAALGRIGLPIAEILLILQALGAAAAIFPLHSLARRRLAPICGEGAALLAALCIYLLPTVSRGIDYDFHPSTIAIAPIAAWIDSVDAGRFRRAWAWLLIALLFREDIGLQVAAAALVFAAFPTETEPSRHILIAQASVGLAWFFGYALLVQPHFLPDPGSSSFGAHFERFGGGAGGVGGVLKAALAHPIELAQYLVSGDRWMYAPALLSTVGFVALADPRWLAGVLPIFGINLLSDFAGVRGVQSHYATAMAPFLVAAGIRGAARIGAALQSNRRAIPAFVMVGFAAIWFWLRGAAPGAPDFSLVSYRDDDFARESRIRAAALAHEPRVVAEVRLLAHLAERPEPLLDPAQRLYWKKR